MSNDETPHSGATKEDIMARASEAQCNRTECMHKLDSVLESINGNGQQGIKTRLALVESQLGSLRWLVRAVLVAVLGLIAAGAGQFWSGGG
jgi:hypothetical protein